jgi:hypothetical protein
MAVEYHLVEEKLVPPPTQGTRTLNRDNVSEWGDMSTHGLLFQ